jgi:hypothetical protein
MDEDLDDPCNLTLPTDKSNQITPLASPTDVKIQTLGSPTPVNNAMAPQANEPLQDQSTPPNKGVRINKTAISIETATIPIRPPQQSKFILQSATNSNHLACDTGKEINPSKSQTKEINDHAQRLLRVFSNDGMQETSFDVLTLQDCTQSGQSLSSPWHQWEQLKTRGCHLSPSASLPFLVKCFTLMRRQ